MNVFTYWEGPMPTYIEVCLASMKKVCPELVIVTPENIKDHLPVDVLHPNYLQLPQPALRADAIRAALLATHGGFWFDADTVGIRNPLCLLDSYPKVSAIYTIWSKPPVRVLNGYIYLQKDNPAAKTWLLQINEALKDPANVSWCSLGEKLLTSLLTLQSKAMQVPRSTFLPIDIDKEVPVFFSHQNYQDYVTPYTVCYGLNHSWFMYHRRDQMLLAKEAWQYSPLLIHQLLSSVL